MTGGPAVSIVVAAVNPRQTMARWLAAVTPQAARQPIEVLVAARAADVPSIRLDGAAGFARVVPVSGDALVPVLWAAAIAAARADCGDHHHGVRAGSRVGGCHRRGASRR